MQTALDCWLAKGRGVDEMNGALTQFMAKMEIAWLQQHRLMRMLSELEEAMQSSKMALRPWREPRQEGLLQASPPKLQGTHGTASGTRG